MPGKKVKFYREKKQRTMVFCDQLNLKQLESINNFDHSATILSPTHFHKI